MFLVCINYGLLIIYVDLSVLKDMTSTRILGCVLRRNCLTARNALFRCDAFFNSKCRASLHMKTQANMRIEPNKWCEKLKGQDTKKIEFGIIKKNKEAGKDGRGEFCLLCFVMPCCRTLRQ